MNRLREILNIHTDTIGGNSSIIPSTSSACTEMIPYKLLSITQVAHMLGVGKDTIYNLLQTGQLGFIEIGKRKKISVLEIQNYFSRQTQYQITPIKNNGFKETYEKRIIHPSNNKVTQSFDARRILEKIRREK